MLKSDRYLITGLMAIGVVAWIVSLYNKANTVDASKVKLTDVVDLRSKNTLQDARIDELAERINSINTHEMPIDSTSFKLQFVNQPLKASNELTQRLARSLSDCHLWGLGAMPLT